MINICIHTIVHYDILFIPSEKSSQIDRFGLEPNHFSSSDHFSTNRLRSTIIKPLKDVFLSCDLNKILHDNNYYTAMICSTETIALWISSRNDYRRS